MNRDSKQAKWDRARAASLDCPEPLLEFMKTGWREDRPAVRPQPAASDYARRSSHAYW